MGGRGKDAQEAGDILYTYSWFTLYSRKQHNIVKQLSLQLKINFKKKNIGGGGAGGVGKCHVLSQAPRVQQ